VDVAQPAETMRQLERQGHDITCWSLGIACTSCIIAYRPTENPTKEASIWIGMLSLNTSTERVQFFDGRPAVISVDTKKKELVAISRIGPRMETQRHTEEVNVHDFIDPKLKRAVPLRRL